MASNRLQLNADKTEFMWLASSRRLSMLELPPLPVGSQVIAPSSSVRDLGIWIDADLSRKTQVTRTVCRCFAALRQLRTVRRSVPRPRFQSLVMALVLSRLDFGNAVLASLPSVQLHRLQSVLNASARLICGLGRFDHITGALRSLHWLCARERIQFKLALLTFRALHGLAPRYIATSLCRISDVECRRRLRSADGCRLIVPFHRLQLGASAFPVAGPATWNSLPADVTGAPSLTAFRRLLKTHLFNLSYS